MSIRIKPKTWDTANVPIKYHYYYILDYRDFTQPKLWGMYFPDKRMAKKALAKKFAKKEWSKFEVVKGKLLKKLYLSYEMSLRTKFRKYDYPKDIMDDRKARQAFRKRIKSRLKRMGLYFSKGNGEQQHSYKNSIKVINQKRKTLLTYEPYENSKKQESEARAFRLSRKPKRFLYLLIDRELPNRKGWLIICYVIKINLKTGEFKKTKIYINSQDFITPYLWNEAVDMIKNIPNDKGQTFLDTHRKETFKPYKGKQGLKKKVV